jgi:DNA-binding NtrC family response regulator/tetratricopeptide (TPR) repeat protein
MDNQDSMPQLLADRFFATGASWMDLATGTSVRIRFAPAGERRTQLTWNDWCSGFAALRHPLINSLVDYGFATNDTTFEAYTVGDPLSLSGAASSVVLTHAVRFIESRGLPLTREIAGIALRDVVAGDRIRARRPLGIQLQRRSVLESLTEVLDQASPGGTAIVDVVGVPGTGLRTARTLSARLARLAGYVPVSSALIGEDPWIRTVLGERHVCILLDDRHDCDERTRVAALVAGLGTTSARRHVLMRFRRTAERAARAMQIEPLGVVSMAGMVFVDRDYGPSTDQIFEAARAAEGRPGAFLARLGAARFDDRPMRASVVHESRQAYVADRPACPVTVRRTTVGRALRDARERARRLAERGRHASAARLLTRATRVLEARSEPLLAAACTLQSGWMLRDRGRGDLALEHFDRARRLAGDSSAGVMAAIGIGVVWTDDKRFLEAEAALRGAVAAADITGDPVVQVQALRALARCLHWLNRHDEASALLARALTPDKDDEVDSWALAARIRVSTGDLRGAVAAASDAVRRAELTADHRSIATAARSMAMVQAALGDLGQVRQWVERGIAAAATAHRPLVGLRLRAVLQRAATEAREGAPPLTRVTSQIRTALRHRPLPALLRDDLEAACTPRATSRACSSEEVAVSELRDLLELAHAATDDAAAVDALCGALVERLRAASVQVVAGPAEYRILGKAGRPWPGDPRLVDRILAGRPSLPVDIAREPPLAAEAVRYGQEAIAVLCCRWTAGTVLDGPRSSALLRAGALAAAAGVRGMLDRTDPPTASPIWAELIGTSPQATELRDAIARAARAPFPVLVEGESGSGKELVARAIHRLGPRRDRRLCAVNCAALSDDLLEAELFGHARGAFTGAIGERAGLFEEADGGTLFLDEVGELSPRAQAKLLRVLQDGEVRRVGENLPRRVDARIVAATNRRLGDEVVNGRFRADLRFRLDVVRLTVPPLRDRPTDVPLLVAHFWAEAAARVGSHATLATETTAALARYDWPGNVREVQNVMASLAVHAPRRGRIGPSMLPAHLARIATPAAATFDAAREDFERRFVRAALAQAGGQRARAARTLGVSRQGLAKMIRRLGIDLP